VILHRSKFLSYNGTAQRVSYHQTAAITIALQSAAIPRSSSLMSLAAWIPSSLSAFSITLLRSRACRSSALIEHPIVQFARVDSTRVYTYGVGATVDTSGALSQACRPWRRPFGRYAAVQTAHARPFHVVGRLRSLRRIVCGPTRRPLLVDSARNASNPIGRRPTTIMLMSTHQICGVAAAEAAAACTRARRR